MANETSTWLALGSPLFLKHGIIDGVTMGSAHPTGFKLCVTCGTLERMLLGRRSVFLGLRNQQGYTGCH
jgi:hypothetical protein